MRFGCERSVDCHLELVFAQDRSLGLSIIRVEWYLRDLILSDISSRSFHGERIRRLETGVRIPEIDDLTILSCVKVRFVACTVEHGDDGILVISMNQTSKFLVFVDIRWLIFLLRRSELFDPLWADRFPHTEVQRDSPLELVIGSRSGEGLAGWVKGGVHFILDAASWCR